MSRKYVFILFSKPKKRLKSKIKAHETLGKDNEVVVLVYKSLIILLATLMSNGFSHTFQT